MKWIVRDEIIILALVVLKLYLITNINYSILFLCMCRALSFEGSDEISSGGGRLDIMNGSKILKCGGFQPPSMKLNIFLW